NNYDWMKDFTFLEFARKVGKLITVNYMMAKDSVKKRLNGEARDGMSFTEFTNQLLHGYDFLHLYQTKNCKLQMGGSDQWGNITTGTELIRRTCGGEAYALTCPLITKSDGVKFGKTESGNVWLDPEKTSPYKFYQFWLNVSDDDAKRYIKIFTTLDKETIDALIAQHDEAPSMRILQKRLAEEITVMVHSRSEYDAAVEASQILFGNATSDALRKLDEKTFLAVFDGVPTYNVAKAKFAEGINVLDLLAGETDIFPSKGELKRTIKGNGMSVNKEKYSDEAGIINADSLINGKYLLVQKGKKNYFLVIAE
ncbi:MAG: tyrosine--tRNA ligase, partial [Bacteroidales bacterium]|nr:tyrosine--tRNA ligase [Bacteroidales bacterium]